MIGHHGRHWWMHKLTEFNAKHINPIFTRDSWRLPDQEIIDIYHRFVSAILSVINVVSLIFLFHFRMNLRDATKIINKADTGITLNKSEQKLAELMLHAPSEKKLGHSFGERPTLSDILRNRASDFHPQNGSAMIDINAIDSSQTALCQKDIEDSDLHHVLKVSTRPK